MGFTASQKRAIRKRDREECFLHGPACSGGPLVAHHRMNRGMGGSPSADRVSNGILVCDAWNNRVEFDAQAAAEARYRGWKIPRNGVTPPDRHPVWVPRFRAWCLLDDDGGITVGT